MIKRSWNQFLWKMSRLLTRLICNFDDDEECEVFSVSVGEWRRKHVSVHAIFNSLWHQPVADDGVLKIHPGEEEWRCFWTYPRQKKFITISAQTDSNKRMLSTDAKHHHHHYSPSTQGRGLHLWSQTCTKFEDRLMKCKGISVACPNKLNRWTNNTTLLIRGYRSCHLVRETRIQD